MALYFQNVSSRGWGGGDFSLILGWKKIFSADIRTEWDWKSSLVMLLMIKEYYSLFFKCLMSQYYSSFWSATLTLNAPIATKVVCFFRLLKCLRSLYGKQCGPRSDFRLQSVQGPRCLLLYLIRQ